MTKPNEETFNILIAEDSENDRFLLRNALSVSPALKIVAELPDGIWVRAYLQGEGQFGDRRQFPLPDMLLLDLKMPRMDGFGVLAWLQEKPVKNLTVVALTDSADP